MLRPATFTRVDVSLRPSEGLGGETLYAEGRVGGADSVNIAQSFTNAAQTSIGSKFFGGYELVSQSPVYETVHFKSRQVFGPDGNYKLEQLPR